MAIYPNFPDWVFVCSPAALLQSKTILSETRPKSLVEREKKLGQWTTGTEPRSSKFCIKKRKLSPHGTTQSCRRDVSKVLQSKGYSCMMYSTGLHLALYSIVVASALQVMNESAYDDAVKPCETVRPTVCEHAVERSGRCYCTAPSCAAPHIILLLALHTTCPCFVTGIYLSQLRSSLIDRRR